MDLNNNIIFFKSLKKLFLFYYKIYFFCNNKCYDYLIKTNNNKNITIISFENTINFLNLDFFTNNLSIHYDYLFITYNEIDSINFYLKKKITNKKYLSNNNKNEKEIFDSIDELIINLFN
jgi:hypothetical protein